MSDNLTSKERAELYYAEMEGACNEAEDAFYAARPHLDHWNMRKVSLFREGFKRGFQKLWDQRAPVEPPALPRVEIELPNDDKRTAKVWWTEWREDKLRVCVQIEEPTGAVDTRQQLNVIAQAFLEIAHAQNVGPDWYTRGESGMWQQVRTWTRKGNEALDALRSAPPPDVARWRCVSYCRCTPSDRNGHFVRDDESGVWVKFEDLRQSPTKPECRAELTVCPTCKNEVGKCVGPEHMRRPPEAEASPRLWKKQSDDNPYCANCRRTWDMHAVGGMCPDEQPVSENTSL